MTNKRKAGRGTKAGSSKTGGWRSWFARDTAARPSSSDGEGFFARVREGFAGLPSFLRSHPSSLGILLVAVVAAILVARIRSDALALEGYTVHPEVVRAEGSVPPWLTRDDLEELRGSIAELESFSVFDGAVRARLERALEENPWVRRVKYVRRELPNAAEVILDIRKPIAWVERRSNEYYLVDRHGVRLPNRYRDPIGGLPYPMPVIRAGSGRLVAPPTAGEPWNDPYVEAGVAVAIELYALYESPMASDIRIASIDVTNLGGRQQANESEILLQTVDGVAIEWGRSLLYEGYGELSTARKLANLERLNNESPGLYGLGETVSVCWDEPSVRLDSSARAGASGSTGRPE